MLILPEDIGISEDIWISEDIDISEDILGTGDQGTPQKLYLVPHFLLISKGGADKPTAGPIISTFGLI